MSKQTKTVLEIMFTLLIAFGTYHLFNNIVSFIFIAIMLLLTRNNIIRRICIFLGVVNVGDLFFGKMFLFVAGFVLAIYGIVKFQEIASEKRSKDLYTVPIDIGEILKAVDNHQLHEYSDKLLPLYGHYVFDGADYSLPNSAISRLAQERLKSNIHEYGTPDETTIEILNENFLKEVREDLKHKNGIC